MKNNCAILNCVKKEIYFKFEDKHFTVNLAEGDLEDSWNTIQFSDNTMLDVNFHWDESDKPYMSLYGLTYDSESDTFNTNWNEDYPISIVQVFGTKADYFDQKFNSSTSDMSFTVYVGAKLVKRTKSLNTASDMSVTLTMLEKKEDVHVIATDKDGATKIMSSVAKKFIDSANIKLNQNEK